MNVGNLWKCVWHRSGMSSNLLAISVGDDVLKWIFIVNSASACYIEISLPSISYYCIDESY